MSDDVQKQKCKRCGKPFMPRKEGQEYGPKCAAIIRALQPEESAVAAYLGAVMA